MCSVICPYDIEIERRNNTPMNLRVCSFCNSGDVGDELHTICMCSNLSLTELRKKAIYQICLFLWIAFTF
jgi:hypothetical protein